jgi:hypothetical protein
VRRARTLQTCAGRSTFGGGFVVAVAAVAAACGAVEGDLCRTEVVNVPSEGWLHYAEGTAIPYVHNPPASGPHYPSWARYQRHSQTIARPYWVHNLEHGAIVFLRGSSATPAVAAALDAAFAEIPVDPACGHSRALMTLDPLLPTAIAIVAADYVLRSQCVPPEAAADFISARRGNGPENICDDGTYPP